MTDTPVEDWLLYLARRERADTTLRTYRSALAGYAPFCGGMVLEADVVDAQAWFDSLADLKPRTRAKTLAAVRSFYKWAMRYDLVDKDPTRRLDAPTLSKGAPAYVTKDQLEVLFKELPADLKRAVALGAYAGLRVSEAAALMWSDIDRDRMRLRVVGKGDKARAIGVHPVLLDMLLPDTKGNVVTGTPDVYSAAALQRRVNRAMTAAGVDTTFHKLRHRFGTITYGITGDPLAVAAAMGHSSLETTRIYAQVSDEALDKVAAAAVR